MSEIDGYAFACPTSNVCARAAASCAFFLFGDHTPRISASGAGDDVLVALPGALGAVDAARHALAPLAAHRRVIAVEYPRVRTMGELCDGLAGVLDALAVTRVDVIGGSLGGFVAQCLVRRH